MVQLNKNENLYGPSPKCYEEIKNITVDDFIYYSRDSIGLIEKRISDAYQFPTEGVILGYGAEDIIKSLFTHYVFPGDKALIPGKSWWYYKSLVEQRQAEPVIYPLDVCGTQFVTNIDAILSLREEHKPKFILICSPNNPTGNSVDIIRLEEVLKASPDRIVCLDETYWGYSQVDSSPVIMEYLEKYSNFVVIRSFSKYFALAGVRVGFAFCGSGVKKNMMYHSNILGFNRISEKLVLAALDSGDYYKDINQKIVNDRDKLFHELNQIPGLTAYQSDANFLLVEFPKELIEPTDQLLKERGIQIKFFSEEDFTNYARISIGTDTHNDIVLQTIKEKCLSKSTV